MITCLKYSNDMVNFFPSPGSYFEDIIRIPYIEDMPIDNRQNTGREDYFQAAKGDFDIIIDFTLAQGVTSSLTGKTAREFFEEKNKRILVIYEYGNYKRSGFIKRETMVFDYTYSKGKDNLRFTCPSITGELIDYYSSRALPDEDNTDEEFLTFNKFLIEDLMESIEQTRLTIVNNLNIASKCEGQVYLSTPLYNDMRSRTTDLKDLNKWIFIKQLFYTFGIKYDMECDFISPSDNGVITFKITLDWRTTSGIERSFTLTEHKKSFKLPEQKEWVMIKDREYIWAFNASGFRIESTICGGILWNKEDIYFFNQDYNDTANMFVLSQKQIRIETGELVRYLDGDIWRYDFTGGGYGLIPLVSNRDRIAFIADTDGQRFSIGAFGSRIAAGVITVARLFVKSFNYTVSPGPFPLVTYTDNTDKILEKTAKAEYGFLLQDGEIDTKTVVFDFPKGSEVNLNDYQVFGDDQYTFERIRLNPQNEEIEADLIKR